MSPRRAATASIIVNNFNYARFLREAIDSALGQSLADSEVIVVDDGSTDGSREIIETYGRAIVPVFKANGGQTSALNAGFAASSGEIVCFLDADDTLEPQAMAEAAAAVADGVTSKVHWPLWITDSGGRRSGDQIPEDLPSGDLLRGILEHGFYGVKHPPTSGNAFVRRFLAEVFPLPEFEKLTGFASASADAYMSLMAPLYGRVAKLDAPRGSYRQHGGNDYISHEFHARLRRDMRSNEIFSDLLAERLSRLALSFDRGRWSSWPHEVDAFLKEVETVTPTLARSIVIGKAELGMAPVADEDGAPFLEADGQYWGLPADSSQAIGELERMRAEGFSTLILAWPCFWWRDFYQSFYRHLDVTYPMLMATPRSIIYDLTDRI
jgi:glycosyltransferase involved in cell wall biosynthesis